METEKTIYTLQLHEYMCVNNNIKVTRVHYGWIYELNAGGTVFVPFHNEFMEGKVDITSTPEPEIVYEYQWLVRYRDGSILTTDYSKTEEDVILRWTNTPEILERLDKYKREVEK